VDHHRANGADVTIGCLPVDATRASDFGLMKIDGEGKIIEFAEKPKGDALENMKVDTTVLGERVEGWGGVRRGEMVDCEGLGG
jgi:glucose-1-phosphate adenylyltransferase